jgi:hypothetical protein
MAYLTKNEIEGYFVRMCYKRKNIFTKNTQLHIYKFIMKMELSIIHHYLFLINKNLINIHKWIYNN